MPRTRTPPDLKWLLNERAALAGKLENLAQLRSELTQALELRERAVQTAQKRVASVENRLCQAQATLAALDRSIAVMHSSVDPSAAGVVNAWAGKYGRRGSLKAFVAQQVQNRAPEAITTSELVHLVLAYFNLAPIHPGQRQRLRRSMKSALVACAKRGLIQPLHAPSGNKMGQWLWVEDRAPSLDELRVLEQDAEGVRVCEAQADPS